MDFKYSYGLNVYDLNIVAIKNIIITWLQMKDGQCFIFYCISLLQCFG